MVCLPSIRRQSARFLKLGAVLLSLSPLFLAGTASVSGQGESQDSRQAVRAVLGSVFRVLVSESADARSQPNGSACRLRIAEGREVFVTCRHVVVDPLGKPYPVLRLRRDGGSAPFRVRTVRADADLDLALLEPFPGESVTPGPAAEPRLEPPPVLDPLYVVGWPRRSESSPFVSRGPLEGNSSAWLAVDARVSHGCSGGGGFDDSGRFVGLVDHVEAERTVGGADEKDPADGPVVSSMGLLRPATVVLSFLGSAPCGSPAPTTAISGLVGRVADPDGQPVPGARILFSPIDSSYSDLAPWGVAAADGSFRVFGKLTPGKWRVTILKPGYEVCVMRWVLGAAAGPIEAVLVPHSNRNFSKLRPAQTGGARTP